MSGKLQMGSFLHCGHLATAHDDFRSERQREQYILLRVPRHACTDQANQRIGDRVDKLAIVSLEIVQSHAFLPLLLASIDETSTIYLVHTCTTHAIYTWIVEMPPWVGQKNVQRMRTASSTFLGLHTKFKRETEISIYAIMIRA